MRTVTRKFAKLYLTRKLNDNLKTYESERLSKGIKVSSLIQQYNPTLLTYMTSNWESTGTEHVALKEQTRQQLRHDLIKLHKVIAKGRDDLDTTQKCATFTNEEIRICLVVYEFE